jgi:hypothetical protein
MLGVLIAIPMAVYFLRRNKPDKPEEKSPKQVLEQLVEKAKLLPVVKDPMNPSLI